MIRDLTQLHPLFSTCLRRKLTNKAETFGSLLFKATEVLMLLGLFWAVKIKTRIKVNVRRYKQTKGLETYRIVQNKHYL
jgi:hypothetical protein